MMPATMTMAVSISRRLKALSLKGWMLTFFSFTAWEKVPGHHRPSPSDLG